MSSSDGDHWDSVVVGGGPAGLSAALCLARACRRVLVLDVGRGRSTRHQVNRNYLGFPGGVAARRLRALGRRQLADYPQVELREGQVSEVRAADGGFAASGQWGVATGRTLILATGVRDHFPAFDGAEAFVGRSMFWCIACDGYEAQGRRIVVAGDTNASALEALQLHRMTRAITLLTNSREPAIDEEHRRRLDAAGIPIIVDKIQTGRGRRGQFTELITMEGRRLPLEMLFVVQGSTPQVGVAEGLGVRLSDNGFIAVDTEQHTSVPRVFAAGDVTRPHAHQVSAAVHEGATAATSANYALYPDALR